MLRYTHLSCIDRQGTGIEAFNFLIPVGWQLTGGVNWILDNPAMPATIAFRVSNPDGKEELEVFPNRCFFWTTNLQLLSLFPPGTKYFGSTVKPPVKAIDALKNIILPNERKNYSDIKIISLIDLPELVEAVKAGNEPQGNFHTKSTGAKMRIHYTKNGLPMEEEFYGIVEGITFPISGMNGITYNTIWYVDYIFSCKAEKGKLENQTRNFQAMTASFRLNPKWFAKYNNIIEYMAQQQIRQIRNIGEFSRMLSQVSDQMRSDQLEQFESRGKVYDKVSEKFSDNMLGIDRYFDPYEGREVTLPSGYNHAWCNNNGEYILTDNPNYNPNEGSNLNWQELPRK